MDGMLKISGALQDIGSVFSLFPSVQTVFLFGSYGTEFQTAQSDVDFAVYFSPKPSIAEEAALLNSLSKHFDTDCVDLLNLNNSPVELQFQALSTGTLIYEKDYIATCDLIERVISRYHHYSFSLEKIHRDYDFALKEAYGNGR